MTGRTLFAIIWALLLLFAIYKIRKAKTEEAKARTERTAATLTSLAVSYGTLDYHDIDGDKSYGLYVSINNNPVFIDIREDKFLDERKEHALLLYNNSALLEENFNKFITENKKYENKKIYCIGLHYKILNQGVVIWEDEEHTTLLEEFNFTDEPLRF
ncbi:MAG: hypothetical protein LBU53_06890 [Zoogloeaceae bacterium]|jgi:hypothetical protein|nr:hypothetical protein [Zoogloeaceae bacterium]